MPCHHGQWVTDLLMKYYCHCILVTVYASAPWELIFFTKRYFFSSFVYPGFGILWATVRGGFRAAHLLLFLFKCYFGSFMFSVLHICFHCLVYPWNGSFFFAFLFPEKIPVLFRKLIEPEVYVYQRLRISGNFSFLQSRVASSPANINFFHSN